MSIITVQKYYNLKHFEYFEGGLSKDLHICDLLYNGVLFTPALFPNFFSTALLICLDRYLVSHKDKYITGSTFYKKLSLLVWLIPLKSLIKLSPISHPKGCLQYSVSLVLIASGSPCSEAAKEARRDHVDFSESCPKATNSVLIYISELPYEKSSKYLYYFLPVRHLRTTSEFSHRKAIQP